MPYQLEKMESKMRKMTLDGGGAGADILIFSIRWDSKSIFSNCWNGIFYLL